MTAPLHLVGKLDDQATTREALEAILAADDQLWSRFERACLMGLAELRRSVLECREALKERGHVFETHDSQHEEVFETLLAIAEELLPESRGAVRRRLRERVQNDVRPRPGGGVRIMGSVDVRRAVEIVAGFEDDFFDESILAASHGHARLCIVARRIRDGLSKAGREYPVEEIEDEVWMLVREMAPDSPAARPDAERLLKLWRRAQEYVEVHDPGGALGEEVRQGHEVRALENLKHQDLPGYRAALRELCRAARDAARGRNGGDEDEG